MAFNKMSEQLSKQLIVLTALAEIDQLILSRQKISDIVEAVITRTNRIVSFDIIGITLLASNSEEQAIIYTADHNLPNAIAKDYYPIDSKIIEEISIQDMVVIDNDHNKHLFECVQPFINRHFNYFLLIPIGYKEDISAFIVLAYKSAPVFSDDTIKWCREFGDRIAVAITNASWEQQLYQQAHFDVLTGLPNRLLLYDRLQYTINQADRNKSTPAILFLDLDQFKHINDSLGHTVGDNLLKQVAHRINLCVRKSDTIARIGGDEFIIILSGHIEPTTLNLITATKKILSEISKPILLEGHELLVTACIGIAIYPKDGDNVGTLLQNSDAALYQAKKQGRGGYQFYSDELNATILNKLLLDAKLHKALENNEFQLYYQAKVDTKTGLIVAAETLVLVRWNHPEKGIISPGVFIPLVEQTGLIIPLGRWIMHEACRQNKLWQQKGLHKIRIAINLSSKQFKDAALFDDICQAMEDSKLDPQYIEMEITESATMENIETSIAILHKIKTMGINISIDDYGTGYSSLEYIKDFPIDVLKIDRAFIINLTQSHKEQAIVKSTITMAHDLGLSVIAEGVEDEDQRALLEQFDCDEIQGFYFSKPVPANKFEQLLAKKIIMPLGSQMGVPTSQVDHSSG